MGPREPRTFAVQLAKHYGAHVTAVCSTAMSSSAFAGADRSSTTEARFTARVPLRRDLHAWPWRDFPHSVARSSRGTVSPLGFPDGVLAIVSARCRFWIHLRGRAVFMAGPLLQCSRPRVPQDAHRSRPPRSLVSRTYALRDIVEAHRYADSGHKWAMSRPDRDTV